MILIAESGATKTDWRLIEESGAVETDSTVGINPFHQSKDEIIQIVSTGKYKDKADSIKKIFYYGAGCNYPDQVAKVENAIKHHYPKSDVYVTHDLLAAARASCGTEEGIACILGTGSNSCLYNGRQIIATSPSLGYILGDEGSGAFLGKKLVTDFVFKKVPETLWHGLMEEYNLSISEILDRIYSRNSPNVYLASFSPFIKANIEHPYMHGLVYEAFYEFVNRHILSYNKREVKINFVGSVAYAFENVLQSVIEDNGLIFGRVVKSPISGLVKFHQQSH